MTAPRTLQRVVFPAGLDPDVLPLYVEAGQPPATPAGRAAHAEDVPVVVVPPQEQHPEHVLDRRRLRVPAGERVSLASYFNAFPAGYWQRWTAVEAVELEVRLSGPARVAVYRSSASGSTERVEAASSEGHDEVPLTFTLPLKRFIDGGWYWFDVLAGDADVVLESAEWRAASLPEAQESEQAPGTITLGVTTFNRPGYLLDLLRQLAGSPEVMELLDEVLVVDQGTQRVRQEPGFEEVAARLGGALRVIEQANVGGSGGFARSMSETLAAGQSRYVLVMDDDVAAEPESIVRAVTFADLCRSPTIVGGHMFNLYAPTRLLHFGEVVKPWRWIFTPSDEIEADHDLRLQGLRATPWMHRRVDVDYNAWWMCLIPVEVLKTVGLSLPVFIKWDDAEYGIRAKAAGFPTVTLPGVAIWHMPFTEKDDVVDWQAYFHQRNRIVAALLHSPYDRGGRLVRDSLYQSIRHLLSLQYSVAELRVRAVEDALAGPDGLHAQLATKLPEVRALRAGFSDSRTQSDPTGFPPVQAQRRQRKDRQPTAPEGRVGNLVAAALIGLQHLRPVSPAAMQTPQTAVPALDAHWWRLAQLDSALVSTLDGTAVSWYRRDRRLYLDLLRRSVAVHQRLLREWPQASRRYRDAAQELASPQAWSDTFASLDAPAPLPSS